VTADGPSGEPATSWREQAVARSLVSARMRAEGRVQRFIDAAFELMDDSPTGRDFTVQEVVERSGQSLRSFYQYFGGKQELLLALFEESVRSTAEAVREEVAAQDDALDRLHAFVVEYHRLCRPAAEVRRSTAKAPIRALAEFAQQLLTAQPAEAARAFVPVVEVFEEILGEAEAAGYVRSDLHGRRTAGVVLEAIMFNAFSTTIGGAAPEAEADPAEELWDLLFRGMSSGAAGGG
jgi:AcrR family transcriptional regulator